MFIPALRFVANLLTSNDSFIVDKLVFEGVIHRLHALITTVGHKYPQVTTESCWAFSNLLASGPRMFDEIVNSNDGIVLETLLELCKNQNANISKESYWAITNGLTLTDPNIL